MTALLASVSHRPMWNWRVCIHMSLANLLPTFNDLTGSIDETLQDVWILA